MLQCRSDPLGSVALPTPGARPIQGAARHVRPVGFVVANQARAGHPCRRARVGRSGEGTYSLVKVRVSAQRLALLTSYICPIVVQILPVSDEKVLFGLC